MDEGCIFNEIPVLTVSSDYMFTCLENTETVSWTRQQVTEDFLRDYPDLILNLTETMAYKMKNFFMQLCTMSSYNSFVNVCRVLYSMHIYQRKRRNSSRHKQARAGGLFGYSSQLFA